MRNIIVVAFALALCNAAFASTEMSSSTNWANINTGNMQIQGSASFSSTSGSGTSNLALQTSVEQFVMNHISVGGTVSAQKNFGENVVARTTNWTLGPSATYYFFTQDKIAAYGNESIRFSRNTINGANSNNWANELRVGFNYFLSPSIAVGPAFSWMHNFKSASVASSSNTYSGLAAFSFYL